MVDFKFGVFDAMKQHVHARQVIGSDVLFLSVDFADAMRSHAMPDIQQ